MNAGERFIAKRNKARRAMKRFIKPVINYDPEFDILYIGFKANKKVDSTVEVTSDFRLDVTKNGTIIGIECENFSDHQRSGKI